MARGSKGGSIGGLDVARTVTAVSIGAWHKRLYIPRIVSAGKSRGWIRRLVLIPIGSWPEEGEYCTSKARNAAWTLSPKPAMPSSMAGPNNATNVRPRIDSRGLRRRGRTLRMRCAIAFHFLHGRQRSIHRMLPVPNCSAVSH